MTPVEALETALRKEEEAISLYSEMLEKYPEIRELLDFLRNEKFKHKKLLEKKLLELSG